MTIKLIGLDVGTKRIGVARADTSTRIAVPDGFVIVNGQEFSEIARIARLHDSNTFVVGLPRNNQGEETAQSAYVRKFAKTLAQTIPGARIYFQDESLTSVEAESRLKSRKKNFEKGDVDAESAAIILQDCIEHFSSRAEQAKSNNDIGEIWEGAKEKAKTTAEKAKTTGSKAGKIVIAVAVALVVVLGCGFFLANGWYNDQLRAVKQGASCEVEASFEESFPEGCQTVKFTVSEAESVSDIAKNLENQDLIHSALAFNIYVRLNGSPALQAGQYLLRESMSTPEIVDILVKGDTSENVFSFTIIPGSTLSDIKKTLKNEGYSDDDISSAFTKDYSSINPQLSTLLSSKPSNVTLEGYLYPDTYEFYKGESVENIIIRALEQLYKVVEENNLIAAYEAQNFTLHEGITLASIVQKEANSPDQPGVARVFLNRLHQGIILGSDVTASYAADLIDPERKILTDNTAVLDADSPYNTRKYAGLPPGPISTPGLSSLLAVANPASSDYLYFLTGDDGVVYYSSTEDEHLQKASEYCKKLCNVEL